MSARLAAVIITFVGQQLAAVEALQQVAGRVPPERDVTADFTRALVRHDHRLWCAAQRRTEPMSAPPASAGPCPRSPAETHIGRSR